MTKQRNSYSREFKLEAIEMVTLHNRKIPEVALELGIGKSTLKNGLVSIAKNNKVSHQQVAEH